MNLSSKVRDIPPEMLLDIAAGMEEPVDIALRYGFTASEYKKLANSQEFLREIAAQRAENDRTGVTAKNKAGMMYDILSERYFQRLLTEDVAIGALAAGVEAFATLGGRKPKAAAGEASGPGFHIVFNIPQVTQQQVQVKDINPTPAKNRAVLDSITFDTVENNESDSDET